MARRGVMTALQAALAGLSGAAGGYVQMQETKKRDFEREQERNRQALRDALAQEQFGLSKKQFEAQYGPDAIARAERIRAEDIARGEREAAENRATQLRVAGISANAAAQRDAAEAARKAKEQSEMGLAWYTRTMSDPSVPQATKNALGLRITEAQQRAGGRLRPEDIGSIASQYMGAEMAERKLGAEEERSGVVRDAGGGGSTTSTPSAGGKPVITRAEYDQLISEGQDSRRILEKYEVRG